MSAAILFAKRDAPSGARIAGIPVAGRTVIERQAEIARRLGAQRLIVMVERMPPDVARAIERLRQDWDDVDVMHDTALLKGAIGDSGDVTVVRDGVLFAPGIVQEFATADKGSIVAVRDADEADRLSDQKMTDNAVTAGLARYPAAVFKAALAQVGDWDLELALPRAARAAGTLTPFSLPEPASALEVSDARGAERWLGGAQGTGRAAQFSMPLMRALARRHVEPDWLIVAGSAFSLVAVGLCVSGFILAGLAMALLGTLVHAAGHPLSHLTLGAPHPRWWRLLRPGHWELGIIAAIAANGPAALIAVGCGLLAAIVLDRRQRRLGGAGLRRGRGTVLRLSLAMVALAATGSAAIALGAALAATVGSIFWRQQRQIEASVA
ncbi:hypothetical protein KCG44_09020 [Pacificimonas sp. WHA3]|uniref:MobA-like NTP transferase domain-containing protein n=1 Tax=Pacificimonas pallii TaxID=2827236 RepID=A0ABS6SFU7_9SPHN|nr:hypothetical protein [Pacificimonas pallii]MBV7256923.1 hypothetical protein [Pacificimonas pallii]